MRILRVAPLASRTGKYGGPFDTASRQASLLAQRQEFEVKLFAPHLEDDQPDQRKDDLTVVSPEVAPLVPKTGFFLLYSNACYRELKAAITDADSVHISISRELFPLLAFVQAIRSRKKILLQPHGMLTNRSGLAHKITDIFLRPILARADRWIALTETERSALRRWLGPRHADIVVIGNPVAPGAERYRELPMGDRSNEAIFIARLHPRKRVSVFLESARLAHQNGWTERYTIVGPDQGDGPLVRASAELLDNLTYEGAMPGDRVLDRLAKAGIFVLPSLNEPWGNVLATSLAIGLPVVLTESAALASTVREAGAGIVVKDDDHVDLANAIHETLTASPAEYAAMSARAADLARGSFSNDAVIGKLAMAFRV